jgi:hypothetical protein
MSTHLLIVGLFAHTSEAEAAARALRLLGLPRERVSIVAGSHAVEGDLADRTGASPGTEIEDSPGAARAGVLGGYALAALALVMPGIGPLVAAGPLAAELGEAAGHLAGGIAKALDRAGLDADRASAWERRIFEGAILVGAHVDEREVERARGAMLALTPEDLATVRWPGALV